MKSNTKAKPLSWRPRKRGNTYCAPACGFDCSWLDYAFAKDAAKSLAEQMGRGWKPRVWENMGWHYSVVRRWTKIHPSIYRGRISSYTAYIGDDASGGGKFTGSGNTPREALDNALKAIREYRNYFTEMLYQAEEAAR